jgi:endonuclease/exonuclease/phosphatase (EEP) superfamily protein YafD
VVTSRRTCWGAARRHPIATGLVVLLASLGFGVAWMSVPTGPPPTGRRGDRVLRIATANIHIRNRSPEAVAERVAGVRPDLLVVLECGLANLSLPRLARADLRPVLLEQQDGTGGICVLAAPRISAAAALAPAPFDSPCAMPAATVRIDTDAGGISVLGVHAPPPLAVCQGATGPTLAGLASWIEDGRMRVDVGAAQAGDPVVVAGDLNSFPFSEGVRRLEALGLASGQNRTRRRRVGTWSPAPWMPRAARIDYVLFPPGIVPIDTWVVDLPGSDHRALVADARIDINAPNRSQSRRQ